MEKRDHRNGLRVAGEEKAEYFLRYSRGSISTRKIMIALTSSNRKKNVASSKLMKHAALKVVEDEHAKMVASKLARMIADKIA